jgi:DNA-binding HxlR family transcriptional regulator
MATHGVCRHDPVRAFGALVGDEWSTLILFVLRDGPFRYSVLHRLLGAVADRRAISQRMLSLRLRALEREGLVDRIASGAFPPRVDYALSELGADFCEQVASLAQWVIKQAPKIADARRRFEDREQTG